MADKSTPIIMGSFFFFLSVMKLLKRWCKTNFTDLCRHLKDTLVVLLDHQALFSVYAKDCYFLFIKYKEHIIIYIPLSILLELL